MDPTLSQSASPDERRVLAWLAARASELADLTAGLVAVPSVTGEEGLVTDALVDYLEEAGLSPEREYVAEAFRDAHPNFAAEVKLSERANVYAWYRAKRPDAGGPVVLNGHIDVVPAGDLDRWSTDPFSGERRDGKVWGRGATDMKGPVAAGMIAVKALRACDIELPFDVQLQLVIGEETGGIGSLYAIETQPTPQAVIVMEPSENRVVAAGGGSVQFTVTATGRAAHGCIPWAGISAIETLVDCYRHLDRYARERNARLKHPLFTDFAQPAPYSVGTFSGGTWRLTVSESGNFSGRLGVLPGESRDDVRQEFAAEVDAFKGTLETERGEGLSISWPNPGFRPWETPVETPLVQAMQSAAQTLGDGSIGAVTYGSDAGHFAVREIPVIIYGPGTIKAAHMADENIAEVELSQAAAGLALGIMRLAQGRLRSGEP